MKFIVLFSLLLLILPLFAEDFYISPNGRDSNDGLSPETPFRTFQKVDSQVYPGDTIHVMGGEYMVSGWDGIIKIMNSGEPDAYITYQAYADESPVIKTAATSNTWAAMKILASYIIFDGIEFAGHNADLNHDDAMDSYNHAKNGGSDWGRYAIYNTTGIDVGDLNNYPDHKIDHVIMRNCTVHDFPGGGISVTNADYVKLDHNTVYNNAWYCMYANSGISVITPWSSDDNTGTKIEVTRNTVYNNYVGVPWVSTGKLSDGNGIIIDTNTEGTNGAYNGRTRVANNLVFDNGGSGLGSYKTAHVDAINNTFYQNCKVMTEWGDIFVNQCRDWSVFNNICYARDGGRSMRILSTAGLDISHNLYFNGGASQNGTNAIMADPLFLQPGIDPLLADFHLDENSPAINSGVANELSGERDLDGNSRIFGSLPDRGCYESDVDTFVKSTLAVDSYLLRVFPNPFNPQTTIQYRLSGAGSVNLRLFDINGRLVETFVQEWQSAGTYTVEFSGTQLPSGLYYVKLFAGDLSAVRKVMLIR